MIWESHHAYYFLRSAKVVLATPVTPLPGGHCSNDASTNLMIDTIEVIPALGKSTQYCDDESQFRELRNPPGTVGKTENAQWEAARTIEANRRNWYLGARGSPKKEASETEAQHTTAIIVASK